MREKQERREIMEDKKQSTKHVMKKQVDKEKEEMYTAVFW